MMRRTAASSAGNERRGREGPQESLRDSGLGWQRTRCRAIGQSELAVSATS